LPASAACVVANGVRETLSSILRGVVSLKLFEPTIPSPQAWALILRDARIYRVRGNVADAALVLRTPDAVALAAALFGEAHDQSTAPRGLSPIECDVIDRTINAVAASLGPVCGTREPAAAERVAGISGFVTYFELLIEEPTIARIGIALSRDPSPEPRGALTLADLADVRLSMRAAIDAGTIEAAAIVGFVFGQVVPLDIGASTRCGLTAQGRCFARGSCGVRNGRYALALEAL